MPILLAVELDDYWCLSTVLVYSLFHIRFKTPFGLAVSLKWNLCFVGHLMQSLIPLIPAF